MFEGGVFASYIIPLVVFGCFLLIFGVLKVGNDVRFRVVIWGESGELSVDNWVVFVAKWE